MPPELSSKKTFFSQVCKGVREGTKNATSMILGATCVEGQLKRFHIKFDIFPFEMKIQGCEIERWISPIFWLFQFLPILPTILPSHLIFQRFQKVFPRKSKTPLSILDLTSANFQILKQNVHPLSETDPKFEVRR